MGLKTMQHAQLSPFVLTSRKVKRRNPLKGTYERRRETGKGARNNEEAERKGLGCECVIMLKEYEAENSPVHHR